MAAKVTASLDHAANCPLRDVYLVKKYVEMMAKLWHPIVNKKYTILCVSNISTCMSLALQYQMCLCDQDIRELDLADCFLVHVQKSSHGVLKSIFGLVFSLKTGKTITAGTTQFSVALHHQEYAQCAVGAFAFHLFDHFHVSKKEQSCIAVHC